MQNRIQPSLFMRRFHEVDFGGTESSTKMHQVDRRTFTPVLRSKVTMEVGWQMLAKLWEKLKIF